MKRRSLTLIAFFISLACWAQRQPASAGGAFRVSGTVVHAQTGEPIAGVTVMLSLSPSMQADQRAFDPAPRYLPAPRNEIQPVVTAPDGRFSFNRLAPGKYSL